MLCQSQLGCGQFSWLGVLGLTRGHRAKNWKTCVFLILIDFDDP